MAETHYGKFTHPEDGREKTAYSAADAVSLRFNGWREESGPTPAAAKEIKEATGEKK